MMTPTTSLDWLDVAEAPELATLGGVHSMLELAITALLAAHPELQHSPVADLECPPSASLWLAEVIVEAATNLRLHLSSYEQAIRDERHLPRGRNDHDDNMPW